MCSKRYAKPPLMYIEQTNNKKTNARMQHNYRGSKKINKETEVVQKSSRTRKKESFTDRLENKEADTTENEIESGKEKRFSDMTIEEKLEYLTIRPSYAPRLVCEIKTEEKNYRGVVIDKKEEFVTIKRRNQKLEVPVEKITAIRILGL